MVVEKKVARGENGGGGDGWEDRVTPVRVFNTITSQYETLQTYDDHYRTLHEGAQSGSGDECEGAPQHKCAPHTWFLESAAIDVAAVGYYVLWVVYWAEGRVSKHRHAQQAGRPRLLQRRGAPQEE